MRDNVSVLFNIHGSNFYITNTYLHGSASKSTLDALLDAPVDHSTPSVYAGDYNLHHKSWALDDGVPASTSGPAEDLATWVDSNDLTIANDTNVYTRAGKGGQRNSIIDLTILNDKAVEDERIADWSARDEYRLDSDHRAICWTIMPTPTDNDFIPPKPIYRYKIDAENRTKWNEAFKAALLTNPPPSEFVQIEDCQTGAKRLLEAMSLATSKSMKMVRADKHSKRPDWWNAECHELAERTNTASGPGTKVLQVKELRSCIRRARRAHADKVCRRVASGDAFALTHWGAGKRPTRIPPLKLGDNLVTEPEEQATALRGTFFPSVAPPVDTNDPLGIPSHPERPHIPITHAEIAAALQSSSNTSSPGAHGSNYRLLKWVFQSHSEVLLHLYNACLEFGHPSCLKHAIVAVIPKARKPDMSAPKAYRPISLLETLSKCLEKVVATRLLFEVGAHNLIPGTQFGGRNMTSCDDAALSLLHDVHTAWRAKQHASLLTLDIKGYFDHVNHSRLVFTLRRLGFSSRLCNWTASYLSDRTAALRFDNFVSSTAPLAAVGIPQGSPLSPVLSSIYSLPVLLSLRHDTQVSVRAYVDDFTILAVSSSVGANATILEHASEVAGSCLRKLGLEFDLEKSELLHLAATKKEMDKNPDVHLTTAKDTNHVVRGAIFIRWLGFLIDRRLNFQEHVKQCARKGMSVLARLRLLASSVRGITTYNARMLYKACVIPVLTYGSTLWFRGSGQLSLVGLLERTQNRGLRWFLGAFSTSPVPAMEHLTSIPPIKITLQRLHSNAAIRMHRSPVNSEIARRQNKDWDTHDRTVPHPKSFTKTKQSPIQYLASLTHPNTEKTIPYLAPPWEHPHPWGERLQVLIDPGLRKGKRSSASHKAAVQEAVDRNVMLSKSDALLCYSDGSLRYSQDARRVGAAFTVQQNGSDLKIGRLGLGPRNEVYDAEMLGLAMGAIAVRDIAINDAPRHVRFYCDNQSACTTIIDKLSKNRLGSGSQGVAPAAPADLERSGALVSSRLDPNEHSGALWSTPEHLITCSLSSYAIRSIAFLRSALERSLIQGGFC